MDGWYIDTVWVSHSQEISYDGSEYEWEWKKWDIVLLSWGWYITSKNGESLSEDELTELVELERDMWAHGLGEYTKCNNCWNIAGKQEIYGNINQKIYKKTVSEIERILAISSPPCCTKCAGTTEYIFPESYKDEIKSRHNFETSFLCLYKDFNHRIRWFMSWYMAPLETIYEREFEHYYRQIGKDEVCWKIISLLDYEAPTEFLCIPALWVNQENISMNIIYQLMKKFFQDVCDYNPDTCGVYESALGTNMHSIYEVCWWRRISLLSGAKWENTHQELESDIFVHERIAPVFIENLDQDLRSFIRRHGRTMKKILENKQ